ncbi:ATP synthase subunit C lysine N-methyltransferase-like [Halichondria panicea]|uniref:ATP synthase subunit C lysine N-methyltransferase-like n=1 Tax=Halichondria panicea TaxID=6063 RepID=UPI00312B4E4A
MAADELKVRSEKLRKAGLAIAGIMGGVIFGIVALTVPFVLPALRKYCLPYVPATPIQTETVLRHIRGRAGRVVDLGSGDGRVCIAAAKQGNFAVGYELNPWLVWYSRWRALLSGVRQTTEFHRRNLWKVDLGEYSTIIIFGVDTMMEPLWTKISKEVLSKQTPLRVIACRFPLHQQTPTISHEMGPHSVWVYDYFTM